MKGIGSLHPSSTMSMKQLGTMIRTTGFAFATNTQGTGKYSILSTLVNLGLAHMPRQPGKQMLHK